jgi:hypothetical protein
VSTIVGPELPERRSLSIGGMAVRRQVFAERGEEPALTHEDVRALLLVALHIREHDQRPTWSWLGRSMGWSKPEASKKIRALAAHGLRWKAGDQHSLEVTARGLDRAMRYVAERKRARPNMRFALAGGLPPRGVDFDSRSGRPLRLDRTGLFGGRCVRRSPHNRGGPQ